MSEISARMRHAGMCALVSVLLTAVPRGRTAGGTPPPDPEPILLPSGWSHLAAAPSLLFLGALLLPWSYILTLAEIDE